MSLEQFLKNIGKSNQILGSKAKPINSFEWKNSQGEAKCLTQKMYLADGRIRWKRIKCKS